MCYFFDTEYTGFGGRPLSFALVPDIGGGLARRPGPVRGASNDRTRGMMLPVPRLGATGDSRIGASRPLVLQDSRRMSATGRKQTLA